MRNPIPLALQVVALAMIPIMLLSIWLQTQILSDTRYEQTMRALGRDASFQVEFERQASALLIAEVDGFERSTGAALLQPYIAQFGDIAGLRAEISRGVSDLVRSPAFPMYWSLASQFIHQQVIDFVHGDSSAITKDGRYGIAIDLQTIAAWIDPFTNDAATAALDLAFSDGSVQLQLTQSRKLPLLQWLARHSLPVAVVSLLGFVAAQTLVIARAGNRRRAIAIAGVGIAIISGLTLIVAKKQLSHYLARIPIDRGRPLAEEYVDALLSGLVGSAGALAVSGLLIAAAMLVWPFVRGWRAGSI